MRELAFDDPLGSLGSAPIEGAAYQRKTNSSPTSPASARTRLAIAGKAETAKPSAIIAQIAGLGPAVVVAGSRLAVAAALSM
jgi:hypothetical protein